MTKAFEAKVIKYGSVDTKKYRYIFKVNFVGAEIKRIEIDKLDTTAALTEWETVKTYGNH